MRLIKDEADVKQVRHQRYQLFYKNIPVESVEYTLHSRNKKVAFVNGRMVENLDINIEKPMPEKQALAVAIAYWGLTDDEVKGKDKLPKAELVIARLGDDFNAGNFRLCYAFDMYWGRKKDKQLITKPERVYIDAVSGEVIRITALTMDCMNHPGHKHQQEIARSKPNAERDYTAMAKSLFVPGTFIPLNTGTNRFGTNPLTFETESVGNENQLSIVNTGLNTRVFRDPGRVLNSITDAWDVSPNTRIRNTTDWGTQAQRATTAHWLMQRVTDFWRTRFLRNGINNNAQSPRLPHVLVEIPGDLNAGWDRINSIGYFNQVGAAPWIVADVSAHEYCHAITQATCNLEYEGQSGAINESLSDIFGTAFERHMFPNGAPGQWNWNIGDDVFVARSMANPPSIVQGFEPNNQPIFQPERFLGPNWRPVVPPCGRNNDFCGVHINSGVMNKWFHTLCEGNGPSGRTITPIAFDEAMNVVYDAQRYYLNRLSNFEDAAMATRLAASILYNECSPQQKAVIAAWRAVDVPVTDCDGDCDFAMGNISVTGNLLCNQAITVTAGCNGPGCGDVIYFITPPSGPLTTNNPATFTEMV